MIEQKEKCEREVKIFAFIPLYSWKIKATKKQWKIFGLPLFKRESNQNGSEFKYYFCGIPIMKVVKNK